MGLNSRQQEAVNYLDGPLLVLAGPGTGKTQLLSAKVAHILEATDALPENILCLTFTEAGASNMRERLLSMIGVAASKVNIHTYHSFGTEILNYYKNYAENFDRNLDNPIDTVAQYKIIKDIVESLPATDILKTAEIKDLISTIAEAKSARLDSTQLLLIAETNLSDTKAMNQRLSKILENIRRGMSFEAGKSLYLEAGKIIAEYTSSGPIVGKIEKEANHFLLSLNDTISSEESKEKPSISALTKWRNSLFEKDNNNHYRLKNFIANKKLLSLAHVMQKYEEYLASNHLFDFTDMIEQAVKALGEDDGFRFTLQERFQYILLDEFQDTNPSQFELVRLLAASEKPDIMAVGDDDQAIFAFQGANASNLIDFQNEFNAHQITLSENYRSTTEILDLSRKIADQIDGSFAKKRNINKQLTSIRNDEILAEVDPNTPLVNRHEFKAADTEYAWVANEISNLIASGERPSDIAIITPKHKYITPLLPFLKAHKNINIAYEKRENILEDPYIHQISTLARFIYEISARKDPSFRLLEILTFPFFKVPALDAINTLKTNHNDVRQALDYLKTSDNKNLQNLAILISELVAKSFDTPLEQFIDFLIGTTAFTSSTGDIIQSNLLNYYTSEKIDFKTYNLYENLSILREKVLAHIKSEKPRLKDFINFLDDYEMAGELILNTSPYQDATDSVQVMTAHKSKGLEFKHVFIIATDDLSWGNSKGNNNKFSLPKNLELIRHTGKTDDECLRLFFVAITRAKKTLTLTNSRQDFSGKTPNRLTYLAEYEVNDTEVCSPYLKNTNVIEHNEELSKETLNYNLMNNWVSNYLNLEPDLTTILKQSIENFSMNASKLTAFIDIAYAGPIEFYKRYIIRGPSEPSNTSMEFGTLVHSVFEKVTKEKIDNDATFLFFNNEIEKLDLTESEKSEIKSHGEMAIIESLKAFRDILVPKNLTAKAEVDLYPEHLVFNNIPITGKIDHINIDETNQTIEIYDFKTSNFHKEKWESHSSLYKYSLQLLFYKLLLNLSPTYKKYKVTKAHILFVSPSSSDLALDELEDTKSELVHDKIYEFSDSSERDFKDLLEAVYKHVKSLDFISENSPLAVLPDKTNGIKQIREFCDLIKETS